VISSFVDGGCCWGEEKGRKLCCYAGRSETLGHEMGSRTDK
jgi:hypothetical protein